MESSTRTEEVAAAAKATEPVARNPQLEAAIERALLEDPAATDGFLVYADWLLEREDPRGELITGADALERHRRYFLGIFADWEDGPLELEWRCGFIRRARLYVGRDLEDEGWDQALLTDALLALPAARFLEELEIGCGSVHEEAIPARVQAAFRSRGPLRCLRKLAFVTDQEEEMLSWTEAGDLGHLGETTPNLTSLFVEAGNVRLGEVELQNLKELVIQTCGLTVENLASLGRASWPSLEKLVLWFGSSSYGVEIPIESVEGLLDLERFPKLTHLGLCNNELTDELVDLLAVHPLLARLEVLDLSKGTLADEGARRLIQQKHRFSHLEKLDLSANYIDSEAAALAEALPQVELGEHFDGQREAETWEGEVHRYADVGE